jgi:hypothetical protein
MTVRQITPFSAVPLRSQVASADEYEGKLEHFLDVDLTGLSQELAEAVPQMNADFARVAQIQVDNGLPDTIGTSATSNAISLGVKTFATQPNKLYWVGQALVIRATAAPANRIICGVSSYDTATGALQVNPIVLEGAGTFTSWEIVPASGVIPLLRPWVQIGPTVNVAGTAQWTFQPLPTGYSDILFDINVTHPSSNLSAQVLSSGAYVSIGRLDGGSTDVPSTEVAMQFVNYNAPRSQLISIRGVFPSVGQIQGVSFAVANGQAATAGTIKLYMR